MSADPTASKQRGVPFKPGQSGNPHGRPKGSRSKLGESFIQALYADFEEHGAATITKVREERPQDYVRVVASILSKEIKVEAVTDLTDEQLDERIRALALALEIGISDAVGGAEASEGSQSARGVPPVH